MADDVLITDASLQAARQLLASVLEIEAAEIADDDGIGQLAGWNSLAHMRLIMAMEADMGRPLSPGNVVAIGSLRDVATVLAGGEVSASRF